MMREIPKILIVDDRLENLIALEKVLDVFDVEFVRAISGNEALVNTLVHDFALAIIDIQMPEMDGYETVELMREEEKTKLLPVIRFSYCERHRNRGCRFYPKTNCTGYPSRKSKSIS
ncbi:MAG: hypothetical protein B6D64_14330 [Bacteroidetes bacterium 4484_276]|nr:MAG: hypothetical protein B6D64_14330 [Bacteroidetes bacterium 4484_276]